MTNTLASAQQTLPLMPGYQFLYHGNLDLQTAQDLRRLGYGISAKSPKDVEIAGAAGFSKGDIYYAAPGKTGAGIARCFGLCRFIAASIAEMVLINQVAAGINAKDRLEVIGILVLPAAYDNGCQPGIPTADLPEMARKAKKMSNISIRGCFMGGEISGLHGEALGRYYRTCYETARLVSTVVPCGMSYLSMGHCMTVVADNARLHPETLPEFQTAANTITEQNDSAFYARLLVE